MRIYRHEHRIVISCTENEFEILGIAVDQIEMGEPHEFIAESRLRKTWAHRTNKGSFLRIDKDRRKADHYDR